MILEKERDDMSTQTKERVDPFQFFPMALLILASVLLLIGGIKRPVVFWT